MAKTLKSTRVDYVMLTVCAASSAAVGLIACFASRAHLGYPRLILPEGAPPYALFLAAWSVAFVLLGVSLYSALHAVPYKPSVTVYKKISVSLWLAAAVINLSWFAVFFAANARALSFVWLCALLGLVSTLAVINSKLAKTAWIALLPYAAWLAYTAYVNLFAAVLNP
jgi:tryptophan-rich sensory protein